MSGVIYSLGVLYTYKEGYPFWELRDCIIPDRKFDYNRALYM
jgi:hypothetical protein